MRIILIRDKNNQRLYNSQNIEYLSYIINKRNKPNNEKINYNTLKAFRDLSGDEILDNLLNFLNVSGIEDEKIEFVDSKWNPYIKANKSINPNILKSVNVHSKEEVEELRKEIERKDKKIENLKDKINKIDEKIKTLKNILKIDVGEQLYLNDLIKDAKNINENI